MFLTPLFAARWAISKRKSRPVERIYHGGWGTRPLAWHSCPFVTPVKQTDDRDVGARRTWAWWNICVACFQDAGFISSCPDSADLFHDWQSVERAASVPAKAAYAGAAPDGVVAPSVARARHDAIRRAAGKRRHLLRKTPQQAWSRLLGQHRTLDKYGWGYGFWPETSAENLQAFARAWVGGYPLTPGAMEVRAPLQRQPLWLRSVGLSRQVGMR